MITNRVLSLKSLTVVGAILVGILGIFAIIGSGGGSDSEDGDNPPPDDPPPIFSVAPVDITYQPGTGRYGVVDPNSPMMLPFGAILETGVLSPAIEYFTIFNTDVRASAEGIVVSIRPNSGSRADFEIHIKPFAQSRYLVVYDHIKTPTIAQGDRINAGTILGKIGDWDHDTGRIELQINVTQEDRSELSFCPTNFGTADFNSKHEALLRAANVVRVDAGRDPWPAVCLVETVVP